MKDSERKTILWSEYKRIRNFIVELIKRSKREFYSEYFTTNSGNLRKIWKGINDIINIKSRSFATPTSIDDNGNIITDPTAISNVFIDHYTSVADKILNERSYNGDGNYQTFLPPRTHP